MWCRNCQQDVPAVARGANGPLVCPRCELDLPAIPASHGTISDGMLSDTGIALDLYDEKKSESPPRIDLLDQDELRQQLRRIGRKLGPIRKDAQEEKGARIDWMHGPATVPECSEANLASMAYHTSREPTPSVRTTGTWLASLLLLCGLAGIAAGAGLLAWSAATPWFSANQSTPAWQWGMTTTIASQGMLIAGLVWMASRLWRNSRRVNRQLQGIDRQLAEIQYQTGSGSDRRTPPSGAYYDHFARGASSQLLLANLRGELEQLSVRIMSQHG